MAKSPKQKDVAKISQEKYENCSTRKREWRWYDTFYLQQNHAYAQQLVLQWYNFINFWYNFQTLPQLKKNSFTFRQNLQISWLENSRFSFL